ncbi:hypothetical protein HispidOSU_001853 [Sigmodon hispidus]
MVSTGLPRSRPPARVEWTCQQLRRPLANRNRSPVGWDLLPTRSRSRPGRARHAARASPGKSAAPLARTASRSDRQETPRAQPPAEAPDGQKARKKASPNPKSDTHRHGGDSASTGAPDLRGELTLAGARLQLPG